jgi:DNA primase
MGLSGACLIHGGTNTTHFRVSISKNCWNCFGKCQCGGNVIDFVSKKEDVSFRDAALLIRDWFIGEQEIIPVPTEKPRFDTNQVEEQPRFRVPDPTPVPEPVESEEITGNKPLKFALTKLDPAHKYLRDRGLSKETIATFGLGYCSKGLLRGYIAIPIHSTGGELVAYAGRWPGTPPVGKGKYKLPEGFKKSLEVFNLNRAMLSVQEAPLVIAEGYFDCIKIHQAGYERVVALMGSSLSPVQEKAILENVDTEEGVIVFFNNDESGRKCRLDVVGRLSQNIFVKSVLVKGEGAQPEHLSEVLPIPEI